MERTRLEDERRGGKSRPREAHEREDAVRTPDRSISSVRCFVFIEPRSLLSHSTEVLWRARWIRTLTLFACCLT